MHTFIKPKPPVSRCHYSNPKSQGTLLAETFRFPIEIDESEFNKVHSYYFDRITSQKQKELTAFLGVGEQGWSDNLKDSGIYSYSDIDNTPSSYTVSENTYRDKKLCEFAKIMFDLYYLPTHVRIIFYYNSSNGYNCPYILCIE